MLKSVYVAVGDVLSSVSTRNSLQLQTKYLKKIHFIFISHNSPVQADFLTFLWSVRIFLDFQHHLYPISYTIE